MQIKYSFRSTNCRYFFTHLTLHSKGELQDKSYVTSFYKHVDPHDILTIIIHLGNDKNREEKQSIMKAPKNILVNQSREYLTKMETSILVVTIKFYMLKFLMKGGEV